MHFPAAAFRKGAIPALLLPVLLFLAPTPGFAAESGVTLDTLAPRGCATLLAAHRQNDPNSQGSGGQAAGGKGLSARVQATGMAGRTYTTTHFAIHYTLAPSAHRVKIIAQQPSDVSLKQAVASLLSVLPGLTTYQRDSSLHAKLDSLGLGHPVYITTLGQYFERAWQYYDSLEMRMPAYASTSGEYANSSQGRFVVDVADVNIAGGFSGPYYGLAFPPDQGGYILFENDFLYGVSYSPANDAVTGNTVKALYPGNQVYRDYSVSWDMGLKVTASHEFYHAVQYSYTSNLNNVHAWYELSATGMEERLAPEVNDYFQYLRFNITKNHQVSLMISGTLENYGNAIFHTFLTRKLGAGFDRTVWEALAVSNVLSNALITGAGSQARWDSLYAAYAAAVSISGTAGSAGSPLSFSPDMPQWPKPHFDPPPATGASQFGMPPLTFRLVQPPATGAWLANLVDLDGAWRIDSAAGGYQSAYLPYTVMPVVKSAGAASTTFAAANTSFSQTRQLVVAKPSSELFASANPVARSQSALFFLAPDGGSSDSLRVLSESGRRVAQLAADSSGTFWQWNLKDSQNRRVPSGLYFFGTNGQNVKTLVVLP